MTLASKVPLMTQRPPSVQGVTLWLEYTKAQRDLHAASEAASRDPTTENRRLRGAAEDRLTRAAASLAKHGGITFSPYPGQEVPPPKSDKTT